MAGLPCQTNYFVFVACGDHTMFDAAVQAEGLCAKYPFFWRRSELRKVTRHLPFELGEITRDRRHVEASEDGFLWLAVEQEPEGCLEAALRCMLASRYRKFLVTS